MIPASIRQSLGLLPGTILTFQVEGDEVVMTTRDAAVAKLQRMFRDAPRRTTGSLVDELIAERRADAAQHGEQCWCSMRPQCSP